MDLFRYMESFQAATAISAEQMVAYHLNSNPYTLHPTRRTLNYERWTLHPKLWGRWWCPCLFLPL